MNFKNIFEEKTKIERIYKGNTIYINVCNYMSEGFMVHYKQLNILTDNNLNSYSHTGKDIKLMLRSLKRHLKKISN